MLRSVLQCTTAGRTFSSSTLFRKITIPGETHLPSHSPVLPDSKNTAIKRSECTVVADHIYTSYYLPSHSPVLPDSKNTAIKWSECTLHSIVADSKNTAIKASECTVVARPHIYQLLFTKPQSPVTRQ